MDNCVICGVHSVLYYCGIEHMLVNINDYIEKGIKERQLIYLHVEPKLYKTIYENLREENVEIENFNITNLIEVYNKGGIKHLAQYFVDCEKKAKDKGYVGIRIINQVSYLLEKVSNEEFISLEKVLTKAIKEINVSIMCAYDFDDYVNKKKANNTLIKQSLNNHNYRFYKFRLMKNTRCI